MEFDWTEIRVVQLIQALATTAGPEKSRHAVHEGLRKLGIETEVLTNSQALELLDMLAEHEGILGITARFVRVRVERCRSLPSSLPPAPDSSPPSGRVSLVDADPLANVDTGMMPVFSRLMLTNLLTGTLGRDVAAAAVHEAADALALPDTAWTHDQALTVLDAMAEKQGIVGVTARFAKARLLLKQAG